VWATASGNFLTHHLPLPAITPIDSLPTDWMYLHPGETFRDGVGNLDNISDPNLNKNNNSKIHFDIFAELQLNCCLFAL
jgi:hypothetical protein